MKVTRSEAAETALLDQIKKYYDEREREGTHASDLLDIRQSYWKKVNPKPTSDKEAGYFLSGECVHFGVQNILGVKEEEKVLFNDITGSIDLPVNGCPGELKGARNKTIPKEPNDTYVEQLSFYCAMKNSKLGYIIVLYYNPGRTGKVSTYPQFRIWEIEFTDEELKNIRGIMTQRKDALLSALQTGNYGSLPLCREWKCSEEWCKWYHECKPEGRYKA